MWYDAQNDAQGNSSLLNNGTPLNNRESANLANQAPAPTIAQTNAGILAAITKTQEEKLPTEIGMYKAQANDSGKFLYGFEENTNPLHACASYTYNISLHVISVDEFKDIMENPGGWMPSKTIIGGAGRQWNRLPDWREDFFIDNLEIEQTVGPGPDNKSSTNNYLYKFNIIEPLGMTLMNRIIRLADQYGGGGAWTQMPYCLEINFNGYDDAGNIMDLSMHTKYFPMKIYQMAIQPTLKGTEYRCEATPYVYEAMTSEVGDVPANFEIEARTLEDFFRKDETVGVDLDRVPADKETLGGEKEKQYKVRSYVSAYNAWSKKRQENGDTDDYDEIEVIFAKEILKGGKIVQAKTVPAPQSTSPDRNRQKVHGKQRTGADPGGVNDKAMKYSITAKTKIQALIDDVMKNTEYYRSQLGDYTKGNEKKAPEEAALGTWVVIPKINKIKSWDKKRGRYCYDITYFVKVNVKHNREDPNVPKSFPTGTARQYDYQYTGLNRDILKWEVKFDVAYTANAIADVNKQSATAGPQPQEAVDDVSDKTPNAEKGYNVKEGGSGKKVPGGSNSATPAKTQIVTNTPSASGGNTGKDGLGMVAANAYDNLFIKSPELCTADITIVGDPCFITQEAIFHPPDSDVGNVDEPSEVYKSGAVVNNDAGKTIKNGAGEIHIRLRWMAPTDLNEATGGYGGGLGGFQQVDLNGLYRVFYIKNVFAGGKFEQQFQTTRLVQQEEFLAKSAGINSLDIRGFTVFPTTNNIGIADQAPDADLTRFKEFTPNPQVTMVADNQPANPLRGTFGQFPTVTVPQADQQGIAAFGKRYDIPTGFPNPAVDPTNLPTGVNVDPVTGLPAYKGVLYTGGQKDIEQWKAAVDAKQPFGYANASGNGTVNTYTPA